MTIGLKAQEFGTRDYTTGRVYFITDGELIKIGYSGAPTVRLKGLQSDNGRELEIIRTVPGTFEDESRLHAQFAHIRVRGEWFQATPDLVEFARTGVLAPPPPKYDLHEISQLQSDVRVWAQKQPTKVRRKAENLAGMLDWLAQCPDSSDARWSTVITAAGLESEITGRPVPPELLKMLSA